MILPRLPRSVPATTTTSSPFLTWNFAINLNNFRGQRNDLHEFLFAQLARDRPEDARAPRIIFFVDNHNGVGIKAQVGPIRAADWCFGPHDDSRDNFTFFDRAIRGGFLDMGLDDVAHSRVT